MSKYIRIAVSVLLLAFIGWRTNWADVGAKFAHLRVELWFAAVGVMMLAQVASARRWQLYGKELRFERSLQQYCSYYFIGTYFSLLLPTSVGGDFMRVWYLNGNSGRKWAALGSVFLERLNGLLVLVGVACVGILFAPADLPGWIAASVWSIAGCAVLGMAAIPLLKNWRLIPESPRQQLRLAWGLLRCPKLLTESTLQSILVQLGGVVVLWCIGTALDLEVPITYYCVLGPMVSLLTLLPVSLNGMGVREGGTVLFLKPLGVDDATALTLAFLWFAVNVAVGLLGGLVYVFGADAKLAAASLPVNEGTNVHGSVDRDTDQGREGQSTKAA